MPSRECGCPQWVVRCAHLEGRVLALTDGYESKVAHSCDVFKDWEGSHYSIGLSSLGYILCPDCEMKCLNGSSDWHSSDLPAAQAEFQRRELELLNA